MVETYKLYLTFVIYFLVMLTIGLYAYLRTNNSEDYFLGGRSLGAFATALSAGASDMSGWLLLGMPGFIFANGMDGMWISAGLLIGGWANWRIIAKPFRIYSEICNNSLTIPEFLYNRFGCKFKSIQLVSSILIIVFFLFYTSAGLVAGGKLFSSVFDIKYETAVTLGALSVVSYTLFGGFIAVCWTDVIQGLMMMAALLIVPVCAMNYLPNGIFDIVAETNKINDKFLNLTVSAQGESLSTIAIISFLAWGLGYFGQPHILARFAAIKTSDELTNSRRIAIGWTILCMAGAVAVGWCGMLYCTNNSIIIDDPEYIFIKLVSILFHPAMAGILLAAILAAIMSTADSQLLICSTSVAEDIYHQYINPKAQPKKLLNIGRYSVAIIAIIATILAYNPDSSVLNLVAYAWAGLGASFGPTLLMSLYWRRMNAHGAFAGVISGGIVSILWKSCTAIDIFPEEISAVYEIIPACIISFITIIVVSLYTEPPEDNVVEIFDKVKILVDK